MLIFKLRKVKGQSDETTQRKHEIRHRMNESYNLHNTVPLNATREELKLLGSQMSRLRGRHVAIYISISLALDMLDTFVCYFMCARAHDTVLMVERFSGSMFNLYAAAQRRPHALVP